jgi:membrane fusion protein, heavy metal efflux system
MTIMNEWLGRKMWESLACAHEKLCLPRIATHPTFVVPLFAPPHPPYGHPLPKRARGKKLVTFSQRMEMNMQYRPRPSRERDGVRGRAVHAPRAVWLLYIPFLFTCGLVSGCQPASPKATASPAPGSAAKGSSAPAGPSKVIGAVKEVELTRVELTPDAEARLGLTLVEVERKPIARAVSYGGEVMIPPGRLISVASPFLGIVEAPPGVHVPQPGTMLTRGQPICVVKPILSPEARANLAPLLKESEGQVKQAHEQLKIAKINMDRQENLVRDHLAGAAALVDAKAQYDAAQTAVHAAEERYDEIRKLALDPNAGDQTSLTFKTPVKGMLQNLHAQIGQPVPAGAILFDVAEMDPVWVKVPVYVGDLDRLATDRPAGVGSLADPPGVKVRPAQPVTAPPSGDPLARTVNLFYQVDNHDRALRPGQGVGVTLPLSGEETSLIVPRSALVRDAHGGSWVYVNISPHAYARQRVFVDRVVGELAALTSGPKVGAKVVAQGVAELYGAEFGGLK